MCRPLKVILILLFVGGSFGEPQTSNTTQVSCKGKLSKISNTDQLYDEFLPRILLEKDTEMDVLVKKEFLQYLVKSATFVSMINCTMASHSPRLLQEDGDDDDDGPVAGGFANAVNTLATGQGGDPNNPLDNSNVLLGVRRILANVFTGNLVGIIQESVGLRSPESVSSVFTDVLSTLFGSMATAGTTGILGNVTTTISPYQYEQLQNETIQKQIAAQQLAAQQQYVQQLQEQGVLDQAQAIAIHHQLIAQSQQAQGQGEQQFHGLIAGAAAANSPTHQQLNQLAPQQQFPQQYPQQPASPPQKQPQQLPQQQIRPQPQAQPQIPPPAQAQQPVLPQAQQQFSQAAPQVQVQSSPAVNSPADQFQQYFQASQLGSGTSGGNRRRRPVNSNIGGPNKQQEDNEEDYKDDE